MNFLAAAEKSPSIGKSMETERSAPEKTFRSLSFTRTFPEQSSFNLCWHLLQLSTSGATRSNFSLREKLPMANSIQSFENHSKHASEKDSMPEIQFSQNA